MKSYLSVLILVLIFSALFVNSVFSQQDPLDSGQADTLYFTAGYPSSPEGDTVFFPEGGGDVTIHINIWNDDSLRGISVPLTDLAYGPPSYAILDSAKNNGGENPLCFVGSRVEDFEVKIINLTLNPPRVLYGALILQADPVPPGDGLFAKMAFTVEDTGTICLDTTLFPPQNSLKFVTGVQTIGFTPHFISRCFHTAPYLCGDANGDKIVNIVDVVYLVNYLFHQGPSPVFPSNANCEGDTDISDAVYLVNYVLKNGPPPCDPDDDGQPDCQ